MLLLANLDFFSFFSIIMYISAVNALYFNII